VTLLGQYEMIRKGKSASGEPQFTLTLHRGHFSDSDKHYLQGATTM
jgi:hypothetical protein